MSHVIPRVLEPEVMDTAEEAEDYDAMDHAAVNGVFCDDLLARRPRPAWVLDVGTGTARIALALCERSSTVRVVATDLADHMLRVAAKNVQNAGMSDRITLRKDDAKALAPFPEPFDVVCSNSVVHHIPEPEKALAAWWSRVPAGALFFVRDLLRPDTLGEVDALVQKYSGARPSDSSQAASFDRQVGLFHASLCAALRLDEVRAIAVSLGMPESAVRMTSDRHFTLAFEKPR
jgi:SAM-dependent methyltransferase